MSRVKLLQKSEIAKAKTIERSQEISEGLKISQRVDDLRKLKSTEEENLSRWRQETLTAIKKEIMELTGERDSLLEEVIKLREEING